jgi:hypothetical protein
MLCVYEQSGFVAGWGQTPVVRGMNFNQQILR